LVTVALESWQLNCNSTRPLRGGLVRLCADATRVPPVPKEGKSIFRLIGIRPFPASIPGLLRENVGSEVSYSAGGSFSQDLRHEKRRSHLFSALLGFQVTVS
jgi:hypothetical protein